MTKTLHSKAAATMLLWVLVAGAFVVGSGPARATESAGIPVSSPPSDFDPLVDRDPGLPPALSPDDLMTKMSPELREEGFRPDKDESVELVVHTDDVPALSRALERLGAVRTTAVDGASRDIARASRPWGARGVPTSLTVRVPVSSLADLAALPYVLHLALPGVATAADPGTPMLEEERLSLQRVIDRIRAGHKPIPSMDLMGGSGPSVSPTSWAVAREHKAYEAWQLGYTGAGVNVAVIDTGEDFGHPSLYGRWAVAPPGSAWAGWPIMYHPPSMEGLMSPDWWTANNDLDRLPLPFWEGTYDGDSWYSNTDYVANDSDADGRIAYQDGTTNPFTGATQYTPRVNPQGYGATCGGPNVNRISRTYTIGAPGDPFQIRSASGEYHLGVARDDTLTGLWCGKVGMLVVDSATPGDYDRVYVDLNFDLNFTNDKPVTQADPVAVADLTGDGIPDISGGLLYFVASSRPVVGDVLLDPIAGESSAELTKWWDLDGDGTPESTSAAVDITGFQSFTPPIRLYLRDPGDMSLYLTPGSTEVVYEEFVGPAASGTQWFLGGPGTAFGPINIISGDLVPTARLLRGPGPDFSISVLLDISSDLYGPMYNGVDYTFDPSSGSLSWPFRPIDAGETVSVAYQIGTYVLEPVNGTVLFQDPISGNPTTFPAGWALLADYDTGLPIPYSQVYARARGYDTFIPASGDLVAFHGDFDYSQSHGSFVSSTIAARPFGNLISPVLEVFGTAPDAKIIGIAACCNVPGPLGLFVSIEEQRTFAAIGYDGRPGTGDEAVIISNSFGDPGSLEVGFTWEDRWLLDFQTRYPGVTQLIALGNNGPGYGTSSPGGGSPGVIGVGAGTSQDYRILTGDDGGDGYWELPLCPPGPYPDPAQCFGIGGVGGPGPYGDHAYFSSRGPTLLGSPKPDIVSIGQYALEAGPLNVFGVVPSQLDGNFALGVFGGTSQATPVTAGVSALVADAFMDAHARYPTNAELRALLKSTADDMGRDVLQQGAGWTNAERAVRAALDDPAFIGTGGGVTADVDYWIPGDYQGVRRDGFVNFLNPGASDSVTITLTNRNPDPISPESITAFDAVYRRAADFRHTFTLSPGIEEFLILKADGIYGADGSVKVNPTVTFQPFWTAADFAKVTVAYDAAAYPGPTALRLDTFDWYDDDGSGRFDQNFSPFPGVPIRGWGERSRMTVNPNGGTSVWDTIHHPGTRIHDGWALNPRSGAAGPVEATLIVEFYEKADWPWIDGVLSNSVIPSLGNVTLTVTATVPSDAAGGLYEGGVYVEDGAGALTTIPIVINVPVGFPVLMGGGGPSTSLYDSSGVLQGARDGWRQIGDVRLVWANISTVASAVGRELIYNAILRGPRSDIEMFVYSIVPDPAWNGSRYGPGTISVHCSVFDKGTNRCTQLLQSKEIIGLTESLYPSREFMHSSPTPEDSVTTRVTPPSGLIAFQIKAWSADAETEPMEANIGILEVTPTAHAFSSNRLAGTVPTAIWSNVPLYDGVGAAVTESSTATTIQNNIAGNPDYAPGGSFSDAWMCSQVPPNQIVLPAIGFVIRRDVDVRITSPGPADDHDLQVWFDANDNGVCDPASDLRLCQSAGLYADEQCVGTTNDGTKRIFIQIGIFTPGTNRFNLRIDETISVVGASPFSLVADSTTVAANTPINAGVRWDMPGSTPPGTTTGALFISPGYARYGLAVPTSIRFTYDITPVRIDRATHLSPAPDSSIREPLVPVVANMADSAGQIDRFSIQLIVDGEDVTSLSSVLVPYNPGDTQATPPVPPGYISGTIAWEHAVPFTDGPHTGVVNVRDMAGNLRTEVWAWTVDTTAPSLAVTSPAADVLTNQPTVSLAARTDPGSTVTVRLNGVPQTVTPNPDGVIAGTLSLSTDGPHELLVTSADTLGNTATVRRTITRDATSPVVTAGVDVRPVTNRMSVRVTGTVNEAVASICASRSGLSLGCVTVGADGTFSIVVPLEEGSNVLDLETTDVAGNTGVARLAPIVRDTIAPSLTVDPLPAAIDDVQVREVLIRGTASPGGLFFVTINGQPATLNRTTGVFSATLPLAVGDNSFVIQAVDDADNVAQSVVSVAYSPVIQLDVPNYNSIIAGGVAIVLLILGFVVGYLLSGRGGPPAEPEEPEKPAREEEAVADDASPPEEPATSEGEGP